MNVHHFAGLSAASPEALQIRVEFSQPAARAFPVMLLVRCVADAVGNGVRAGDAPVRTPVSEVALCSGVRRVVEEME